MKIPLTFRHILLGTLALYLVNWGAVFHDNILLVVLILLLYLLLVLAFFKPSKLSSTSLSLVFLVTLVLQITTTRFWNEYKLSPFEKDRQLQRVNYYPPRQGKLSSLLEINEQVQFLYKWQSNFFSAIDFNQYFPNYFSFFAAPFFLHGLFLFIRNKNKFLITTLLISLILLAFLGVHGTWGPFLIFPFILLFINLSLNQLASLSAKAENHG